MALFRFYSGSKDNAPGFGPGEHPDPAEMTLHDPNFRKIFTCKNGSMTDTLRDPAIQTILRSQDPESLHFLVKRAPTSNFHAILLNAKTSFSKFYDSIRIPEWRTKLSNFHPCPLQLDDLQWSTVEHYFQAKKIQLVTGDELSIIHQRIKDLSCSQVKQSTGRKDMPMTSQELDEWEMVKKDVLMRALRAKFSSNSDMKHLLLATRDAELSHQQRGILGDAFGLGDMLMQIRNEL